MTLEQNYTLGPDKEKVKLKLDIEVCDKKQKQEKHERESWKKTNSNLFRYLGNALSLSSVSASTDK